MAELTFDKETHTYMLGDRQLISVTQLMQKHDLAPDYSNISTDILNAKAERGTLIHKEIEEFVNDRKIGFTPELDNFMAYLTQQDMTYCESEKMVCNDIVAGTIDLILNRTGQSIIADIKTTSTLHKEAVSWQLSIYLYLYVYRTGEEVYSKYTGQAFHFLEDGSLNVIDIPLKPYEEVHKLIECERKGEIYNKNDTLMVSSENQLQQLQNLEYTIKELDARKKELEATQEQLKSSLMQSMKDRGLLSVDFENLKLTIVSPKPRETVDTTRMKKEIPEIVNKYIKVGESKEYLKITLRGDN